MNNVCRYFSRCLDKESGKLCIENKVCRTCALSPYGEEGHFFESALDRRVGRLAKEALYKRIEGTFYPIPESEKENE